VTRLVLVRHGETVGNSAFRLYGRTDVELSEVGRRQMRRVADALRGETFDAVVVSPLRRSREAASIIAGGDRPAAIVVHGFTEIDFGRWEGLTADEVAQRDPDGHAAWRSGAATFRFPEGESRGEFHGRVAAAVPEVFGAASGGVLAVLHKGVIKIVMATLLRIPIADAMVMPVHLGSIHRLVRADGRWAVGSRNEIEHLGPDWIPDGSPR
jgi:broad specificity phosphatase PhoE